MTEEIEPVRLLMLQDTAIDADLALSHLRNAGLVLDVTLAVNRREFEHVLSARPYDLILASHDLPGLDGPSALTLARKYLPHTPFIFIVGRLGEEAAAETLGGDATDYVPRHRMECLVPAMRRALLKTRDRAPHLHAEATLHDCELRFHQLVDAISLPIWMAASDGWLLYGNMAWKNHMSGPGHWLVPGLFHSEDYPVCAAAWEHARVRREPLRLEARLLCKRDHAYRWHVLRLAPVAPSSGTHLQADPDWLGTATDIQDWKLNEEALRTAEKLSVTGRMAAAIAHEINNPLESVTNLLFLVKHECIGSSTALSYLKLAEEELERIALITRQTLQFYRDPTTPVEVDARYILEDVIRLFHGRLTTQGIKAALHMEPGISFQAIRGEIRQVLINLIGNAIDAVGSKGKIDVEADHTEWKGKQGVQLLVHDNGPGITDEQAQRLFTPFFSTKGAQGTGLGLWVSKGIVEKHGGTLHLATRNANGSLRTTATVILPRAVSSKIHHTEHSNA